MEEKVHELYDNLQEEFDREELMDLAKKIVLMESVANRESGLEKELSNLHSAFIDFEVSRGILDGKN